MGFRPGRQLHSSYPGSTSSSSREWELDCGEPASTQSHRQSPLVYRTPQEDRETPCPPWRPGTLGLTTSESTVAPGILGLNPESLGGEGGAQPQASQGGFEDHPVPISSPAVPGPDGALPRPDSWLIRSIITYPRSPGGRPGENLFPRNPLSSSRPTAIPAFGCLAEGSGRLQKAGAGWLLWLQVLGLGPRLWLHLAE